MQRISGAYLCDDSLVKSQVAVGVKNKIQAQIAAFGKAMDCKLITFKSPYTIVEKVLKRIPFIMECFKWPDLKEFRDCSYVYIRNPGITKSFILFLKQIKRLNPSILIVLELPTYPYDGEFVRLSGKPLLLKDRWNRRHLKKYVDCIVTYTNEDSIFGIPVINIMNGVDIESIKCRQPNEVLCDSSILHIICCARFDFWHGIDRLLEGLYRYRKQFSNRLLMLHLVGDGPAIKNYKNLVKSLELEDCVTFHGTMNYESYCCLYDQCRIAVECLGNHRKGCLLSSSLKSREYLASGIPFVYSGYIDVFEREPVDFCLQLPADDSSVDVQELMSFCDYLYGSECPDSISNRIRSYAERYVAMDRVLEPVIEFILRNSQCGIETSA